MLAKRYSDGKPVYIDYILAEPKDIECTEEQITILNELYNKEIYNPTTNIYSTDEINPNITLKYNYVIPSPSPERLSENKSCGDDGNINFEICNKNTFNIKRFQDNMSLLTKSYATVSKIDNGFSITSTGRDCYFTVEGIKKPLLMKIVANVTNKLTYKAEGSTSVEKYIHYYSKDFKLISGNNWLGSENEVSFVPPSNAEYCFIRFGLGNKIGVTVKITDIMLSTDEEEYIQNQSQTYTIPVQQPFRKIDEYEDTFIKKNGKWYERHYIDRYIFTGQENWTRPVDPSWTNRLYMFGINIKDAINVNVIQNAPNIKSNYYEGMNSIYHLIFGPDTRNDKIAYYNAIQNIWILDRDYENPTEYKKYLKELYEAGKPIYIDYIRKEPKDIECNEQQNAILAEIEDNAKTYQGITHIYSTDEIQPNMSVTYIQETNEKIKNEGNINSRPVIRLEKTISKLVELTINEIRFIYDFEDDDYVEIDCEKKTVKYNGLNRNRNIKIGYDFPKLNIGDNKIIMHKGDCVIKTIRKDRWL